jgi:demethylphylloquinol methyltransferase
MTNTSVQNIFNRIAPVYDQINDLLSLGQHRIWKLMAIKWVNPQVGNRGLDLCCGSGDLTQQLAEQIGKSGLVYGVDFSQEMLTIADKKHHEGDNHYPIKWIEADVLNLPFADNYFDCAVMGYGLRNVVNIPQCLAEIYRVLKPDTKVAILDFHKPYNYSLRSFQQWYLDNLVVPVAKQFGLTEEYAYIQPSLDKFPTGREQVKLGYEAGFTQAVHYPIAGGMMGVLVLTK